MSTGVKKENKEAPKPVDDDSYNQPAATEHDDEFVSELHQASSKDLAEADEAMKKLGLSKVISDNMEKVLVVCLTSFFIRMIASGKQS